VAAIVARPEAGWWLCTIRAGVTGMLIGPCRARDHGMLPDPSCTPGTVDPAVTQANIDSTICTPG
jgi:hypothetical protein